MLIVSWKKNSKKDKPKPKMRRWKIRLSEKSNLTYQEIHKLLQKLDEYSDDSTVQKILREALTNED